ncbi:hypothetical protein GG681_00670 [Epibacterium sp. SM1969]|uniref:Uncharacterized protein n=1 Tax=Tritonibacter aquimaris TaxID=2663379 RepID=A0A844AS03_9RHOB|nr:hypothetical protein [Tritonibacter aquimaris]MQY41144.1 hypothetical protein [Tritonibacter aquimaris]
MLQNWPPVKTTPIPHNGLRIRALASGCAAVLLVPFGLAPCAGALSKLATVLGWGNAADLLEQFAVLMTLTLIGVLPSLLLAVPLARLAMRWGRAGWLSAILSGAVVGYVFFAYILELEFQGQIIGTGFGLAYGALFWLGARLAAPEAFIVRDPPGKNM